MFIAVIVTPLVGVWIEIFKRKFISMLSVSLPLWECGLKFASNSDFNLCSTVTPLVGVWIETNFIGERLKRKKGHSPCGSVD